MALRDRIVLQILVELDYQTSNSLSSKKMCWLLNFARAERGVVLCRHRLKNHDDWIRNVGGVFLPSWYAEKLCVFLFNLRTSVKMKRFSVIPLESLNLVLVKSIKTNKQIKCNYCYLSTFCPLHITHYPFAINHVIQRKMTILLLY